MNDYEGIPAHWELSKAKRYVRITNGSSPTTEGNIPVYGSGKKPFMTCGEYKTGPAVLLGRKGTINNPAYVEGLYWNVDTAFDVKPLKDDFSIKYYYYLAMCFDYGFYMTQTAIPSMTQTDYYNMIIPVPPIEEQEQIARFLDWKISGIDRLISIRKDELTNLEDLKKAVITRAVTRGNREHVKIKRLFKIFSGATPDSENPNFWDGNIIWITPADFQTKDKYIYHGAKNITESGFKACSTSLVPSGSIIFTKRAPVGKVAISKSELCTNQGCLSCVPLEGAVPEYFYYVVSICTDEFESLSAGATFKEISLSKFRNVLLPCPPMSEQKRIADYLDKICSEIDRAITNFTAQIDTLKELKARLISDTVTGKIDVRNIPIPEQEKIS